MSLNTKCVISQVELASASFSTALSVSRSRIYTTWRKLCTYHTCIITLYINYEPHTLKQQQEKKLENLTNEAK